MQNIELEKREISLLIRGLSAKKTKLRQHLKSWDIKIEKGVVTNLKGVKQLQKKDTADITLIERLTEKLKTMELGI